MKGSKFIALALAAGITLMGAGYAAWNETATINHTVSTGELDITLSNGTATFNGEEGHTILHEDDVFAVGNVKTSTDNVVNIDLDNLYPGLTIDVEIPIANTGSIPVKIDPAKVDVSEELVVTGAPAWLTITEKNAPETLYVGESDKFITFKITVGDNAPENELDVQFTLDTNYVQFNDNN